ncbi:hypothetical protein GW17_00022466 [Ensete ventricosum]|nr:hypothetical protein GW17_00022466 [Ensete ventricosum]
MKGGFSSRPASQPVQMPREKTLVVVVENCPVEKAPSDLAEKCPTEGGDEPSTKRKKWMAKRNEVLEIKSGVGPKAVVVAEKRATDLEAEVKHLRAKAECLKATLEDAE